MKDFIKIFSKKEKYKELYNLRKLDFNNMEALILHLVCIKNIHILNTLFKSYKKQMHFSMINNLKTKKFMIDLLIIPVIFSTFLLILTLEGDLALNTNIKLLVLSITFTCWMVHETLSTYYKKGVSTLIQSLKVDDEKRLATVNMLRQIIFNGEKEEVTDKLQLTKNESIVKKRRL